MVFIYSSYQKYCADSQKEAQKLIQEKFNGKVLLKIPSGTLEGILNTAFLSLAGNLILSKGKWQPVVKGALWGLSIKVIELATRIIYQMLQDYASQARQKPLSDKINTPGEILTMSICGIGLWGAAHYLKISKISILAAAALILLRKLTKSETVEILFLIPPLTHKGNYGDYLQHLSNLVPKSRN